MDDSLVSPEDLIALVSVSQVDISMALPGGMGHAALPSPAC